MRDYYILSVDSLVDSFSMMDAAKEFVLSVSARNGNETLSRFKAGDQVLVYRRQPVGRVNVLLESKGTSGGQLVFGKKLEVAGGVQALEVSAEDLEQADVIQIAESVFLDIYRRMVSGVIPEEPLQRDEAAERLTGGDNILLYGVPGVGKSYEIRQKYCDDPNRIVRVVFHPDYTYSDFVGQILPILSGDRLTYDFVPGPFTNVLEKVHRCPDKEIYLVIEEINRGNAPAIFGELFQLLDRKSEDGGYASEKWGESEYGVVNYDIARIVYEDERQEIRIPSNMWILATMNTSDQNVFPLDTAFQRRWNMQHIKNDIMGAGHAHEKIQGSEIEWGAFAMTVNGLVTDRGRDMAGSEDKRLGAYFVRRSQLAADKFPEKVLKYLWDDAFRMDRETVFQDRFRSLEDVIETYEKTDEDKLEAVLQREVFRKMRSFMQEETGDGGASGRADGRA